MQELKIIGCDISASTLSREIARMGYTRKVGDKLAIERDTALSEAFLLHMRQYDVNQLIFGDETAIDKRSTNRRYGYSLCGENGATPQPFTHGKK
jgi:hypothetical protein